jgi:hypothetical protein
MATPKNRVGKNGDKRGRAGSYRTPAQRAGDKKRRKK